MVAADVVGTAEPVNLVEQETGGETLRALGDEPVEQNDLELITEMALRAEKAAAAFRIQHNEDLVVTFGVSGNFLFIGRQPPPPSSLPPSPTFPLTETKMMSTLH
jgi:hypothetical protein